MKKTIWFGLFGAIAFSILLAGCSTDNTVECPADYEGALVEEENGLLGTWELSAILAEKEVDLTKDDEQNPKKDIYAQYTDCEKDGEYTFGPGRTYKFAQGQHASNCSNKLKIEGSWKLSSDILGLIGNCSSQNLKIVFNEDKSEFSTTSNYNITDVNGATIQTDVKFTYTKVEATE
ncbi:DUF5004 domain-containing protein [Arenibacter sp. M-2]|uniref:DUF5004 domain-containing protein n=1 Tax=Arenibacter sp. M-2 TaxID=3053612 RepID=UPI00256FCE3A|nr:DUF5004 domain-containing protein [Arenibacter sp. M-2]MDL5513019.1 DUF5004 domain-containing protein [Arenibacter sp. M-2]|tara:strand:+ start:8846 stop:9376 length:531 start_codon:yes stop_codon:yes gene_type:complete